MIPKDEFRYASDLVAFIKSQSDFSQSGFSQSIFSVSGACYPEKHLEAPDAVTDIRHLKEKVDAGVSHLISQLFFENERFYDFYEKTRIAGINVPIEAGIMPVTNKKQIERMIALCGATLPPKFKRILDRYEDRPDALFDAGMAYAINQIIDLIAAGVDGIHIYTMNKPLIAQRIYEGIKNLI
jgi:methylenetetrahydrofolate reductase (NADPH)